MASTIMNNTYSYLLTLDEFRNALPQDIRPSWIKLTTITMISSFQKEISIEKLKNFFEKSDIILYTKNKKNGFRWKLKPTTFYNQITLTYEDVYSVKSVKIFPNGSIQVAGCNDLINCKHVIEQLVHILSKFDEDITPPVDSFRVVMINSNFSLNYNINLMKLAGHFGMEPDIFKVSFEPDRYSAVKVKFRPCEDMKEITVSMFSTGKVIITGAETLKEVVFAYNIINDHINTCDKLRVSKADVTDTFDIFSGYPICDLIKKIRERGYKSWVNTIENRQINF